MSLYFGYKKPVVNTECLEKSISNVEKSFFKKDGSSQMTGDLDMGDNSIVGIHDINASNSVVSKKYVNDELGKKFNKTGGSIIGIVNIDGELSMVGNKMSSLDTPTSFYDATTKKYVDDKTNSNKNNITALAATVTTLESIPKNYTYNFYYSDLKTSWQYPRSNSYGVPYYWMYCKGLTSRSKFHVHNLIYDTDATIENNYIFTFKLDFFKSGGGHVEKEIFTARRGDHVVPGETILIFIDKKFTLSSVADYKTFVMARLAIKGSSTKGNEMAVSCSFEI